MSLKGSNFDTCLILATPQPSKYYRLLNGMYRLPCFFINAVNGHSKKKRKKAKNLALAAGA